MKRQIFFLYISQNLNDYRVLDKKPDDKILYTEICKANIINSSEFKNP